LQAEVEVEETHSAGTDAEETVLIIGVIRKKECPWGVIEITSGVYEQ